MKTQANECERSSKGHDAKAVPVAPKGWKLVPEEPTEKMQKAGTWPGLSEYGATAAWKRMLKAAPVPASEGNRWRHKKRGTTYREVDAAKLQLDGPDDMALLIIYEDEATGELWARKRSEFMDGRFEEIPAPPVQENGQ